LAGHGCIFAPEAIVYHHYRATMTNYPARQAFYSQRNIEFVYIKNLPLGMLLTSLPQRALYEMGGALYFFRQGVGLAFVKAKLAALRQLPALLRKRKTIQARRKISSAQLRALTDHAWLGARIRKVFAVWRRAAQPALSSQTH
jgi:GT2 family glycosyltransferase